jgi:hypothetical protein
VPSPFQKPCRAFVSTHVALKDLDDASDVHPDAVCSQAQMPGGPARIIHRAPEEAGFNFAIEAKTKKAESNSPSAIVTKVDCPPLTHFDD